MKDTLHMICDDLSRWWQDILYEADYGPAPWSHLDLVKTIHSDGPFQVKLYRCNCGPGNYLIDLQKEDLLPPTVALIRSQEFPDILELLSDTKLAMASDEYCDD